MFPRRVQSCRIISYMFQCQAGVCVCVPVSMAESREQEPGDDVAVRVRFDHIGLATCDNSKQTTAAGWRYENSSATKFNVEFKSSGRRSLDQKVIKRKTAVL